MKRLQLSQVTYIRLCEASHPLIIGKMIIVQDRTIPEDEVIEYDLVAGTVTVHKISEEGVS